MIDYTHHPNAERILQDGWELFQHKGYRGVSIDTICTRCGITKPTLYYYFHTKENLYVEILLHRLQGFHQVIEQTGDLEKRLTHIAQTILESFQTEYSLLVRDLEHIHDPLNSDRIRTAFANELFIPITRLMQTAIATRQLNGDPRFLAQMYMGMVESYIARAAEFGLDNATLAQQLAAFFLKGAQP